MIDIVDCNLAATLSVVELLVAYFFSFFILDSVSLPCFFFSLLSIAILPLLFAPSPATLGLYLSFLVVVLFNSLLFTSESFLGLLLTTCFTNGVVGSKPSLEWIFSFSLRETNLPCESFCPSTEFKMKNIEYRQAKVKTM
ncbi:uncharacterized protein LOC126659636 [Mercurialis annua]|uniref:uncharacterized protein LOC126659636 n=1 Tax=Mercurialis annua TaxID=3986 RepID=UPI0024AF924F|nr:uncharacterized protein LOC126659636 [Mercurialis annua]